jgi:hypothetical protein
MNGVFLHTGWRSAGTWLWEELRRQPGNMGFYEPLHECLAALTFEQIAALRSDNWKSRHPWMTRPYFAEYAPLLRREGVIGARLRFSFDRFFMDADQEDAELLGFVRMLCDTAKAAGRQPVLKFARSQGRFAWFAQHFPDVTHALLIRQPWEQFRSAWRCLVEDSNPYFLSGPFMVLERNMLAPQVAALVARLAIPVRPTAPPVLPRLKYWYRIVRRMAPAMLYRAHFALWVLNTSRALPHAGVVLEGGEAAAALGLAVADKRPLGARLSVRPGLGLEDVRAAHDLALRGLPAEVRLPLARWVAPAEAQAAQDLAAHLKVRRTGTVADLVFRAGLRLKAGKLAAFL